MPNPTDRPSLNTDLATRYATQKAGGAYDAKAIITQGVDGLFASMNGAQFQKKNGFLTEEQLGQSDFKNDGLNLSTFVKNLDTTPYDHRAK